MNEAPTGRRKEKGENEEREDTSASIPITFLATLVRFMVMLMKVRRREARVENGRVMGRRHSRGKENRIEGCDRSAMVDRN